MSVTETVPRGRMSSHRVSRTALADLMDAIQRSNSTSGNDNDGGLRTQTSNDRGGVDNPSEVGTGFAN